MASFTFDATGTITFESISRSMVSKFDRAVSRMVVTVKNPVKELVGKAIEKSPEYQSIATGRLWHQLGLENPGAVLLRLVTAIQESIDFDYEQLRLQGTQVFGGLYIGILKKDYSDVLRLEEASYISPERGYKIDWLEWLLKAGNNTILAGYHYAPVPTKYSRTGFGVMSPGGSWRIPAQFAGTESENFLTRALNPIVPDMEELFIAEIKRNL